MKKLLILFILLSATSIYAQQNNEEMTDAEIYLESSRIVDSAVHVAEYEAYISDKGINPKVTRAKAIINDIYSKVIKQSKKEITLDQLLSETKPLEYELTKILHDLNPIEKKHVELYKDYEMRKTQKILKSQNK